MNTCQFSTLMTLWIYGFVFGLFYAYGQFEIGTYVVHSCTVRSVASTYHGEWGYPHPFAAYRLAQHYNVEWKVIDNGNPKMNQWTTITERIEYDDALLQATLIKYPVDGTYPCYSNGPIARWSAPELHFLQSAAGWISIIVFTVLAMIGISMTLRERVKSDAELRRRILYQSHDSARIGLETVRPKSFDKPTVYENDE